MQKWLGARAELSLVLIAGAAVLVLAIMLGVRMGNSVLLQIAKRPPAISTTPVPLPTLTASEPDVEGIPGPGRRHQAIAVATDPGFPDPRVTPEPPPPQTPRPRPKAQPSPSPGQSGTPSPVSSGYTSPPLALPLVSHPPEETSPPDEGGGKRDYPTLPPVSPSQNPAPG